MGTRALKPTHFLQEEGGVHLPKSISQSSACYPPGGNQYSLGVDHLLTVSLVCSLTILRRL